KAFRRGKSSPMERYAGARRIPPPHRRWNRNHRDGGLRRSIAPHGARRRRPRNEHGEPIGGSTSTPPVPPPVVSPQLARTSHRSGTTTTLDQNLGWQRGGARRVPSDPQGHRQRAQ